MGFFDIIGILGGFFDAFISWVISALVFLYNLLVVVGAFLWHAILVVVNYLWIGLKRVANFSRVVWDKVIKGPILKLFDLYEKLRDRLERILGPVLRVIRRIRHILDEIFNRYIAPILNTIQRMRRVLAALRILHIKWAERLDRRLLRIETTIAGFFLEIRAYLNLVANILNGLLDPEGLILAQVFHGSVGRWLTFLGALLGALTGDLLGGLTGVVGFGGVRDDMKAARAGQRNWLSQGGDRALATFHDFASHPS